jgi:hypothetical protein
MSPILTAAKAASLVDVLVANTALMVDGPSTDARIYSDAALFAIAAL